VQRRRRRQGIGTHDCGRADHSGRVDDVTLRSSTTAAGLSSSTVLRFPDAAHDVMIWSPSCAVDVMYAFLDADGGDFDHRCVDALAPAPFTTS